MQSGDVHPNPGPHNHNSNCISIYHSNIRSLNVKIDLEKFDVITLSETWLKSSIKSEKFTITNYYLPFREDRKDDSGYGDVLAWVKNDIFCK